MKNSDVKSIGGQEFQKVKWGLAEKQVIAYIDKLIKERDILLEKQQHLDSLKILAEKTVTDANDMAQQLQQEAQEQADKLVKEAEQRYSETLDEARSEADSIMAEANELSLKIKQEAEAETANMMTEAEAQANEILSTAQTETEKKLAEVNELSEQAITEANEQADSILKEVHEKTEKTKKEAQEEATSITEEAEQRASAILDEAQSEAEKKVIEVNELVDNTKQEAQNQAEKIISEAEDRAQEMIQNSQKRAETEVAERMMSIVEQSKQRAAHIIETVKENVTSEIEEFQNRFNSRLESILAEISASEVTAEQTEVSIPSEETEALVFSVPETEVGETNNNGSQEMLETQDILETQETPETQETLDTIDDIDYQFAQLMDDKQETDEELVAVGSEVESAESLTLRDDAPLFTGEIEIAMPPPVDMAQLIRFRRILQSIKNLKVLRTTGSWNEGSIITSLIDKPLPLLDLLQTMPEVEKAEVLNPEESEDNTYPWGTAFEEKPDNWQGQRIVVTLQEETE